MPRAPTSNFFFSQRLRLHYVDWGNPDAPPLILLHGGRDHARSWDWVAQDLMHDWHVIAPDLRGHGDSAWSSDGNYQIDALVYDFAQLVHQLGERPVTIIAHSLGGNVATRFAGLYPDKVARLVNIEGLGPSPKQLAKRLETSFADRWRTWIDAKRTAAGRLPKKYPTLEDALARMQAENAYLTAEQARHLTVHGTNRNEDGSWSWKFDNHVHVWPWHDIPNDAFRELCRAITCPVLLLYGANSWASNPQADGRIADLPTARVVEFADAGHWLHHDQFDRFMRDVRSFLGEQHG